MRATNLASRAAALFAVLSGLALTAPARAQDAGVAGDADLAAAAAVGRDGGPEAAAPVTETPGSCHADPAPAGHDVRVEVIVAPQMPVLGDRVIITYRIHHRAGDSVQFDPDPAAFAQPGIEMEYARVQPERDRSMHAGQGGRVYGEVRIAVQPFRGGDVVIGPQLARLDAAGDIVRVCTPEVRFRVRDPFGNEAHPGPRDLTGPESVTEDALKWRTIALILDGIFLIVLATLIVSAYLRRRPRPVVPPPPPRPAWIVALEQLDLLAKSDLLSRGLTKDYYDAISDVVRRYIGGSRGFDAIEMTTDEVLARVRRDPLPAVTPLEVEHLLGECDLVKFARYVPSHEESENILAQAYGIVRRSASASGAQSSGTPPKDPNAPPRADAPRPDVDRRRA